MKTTLTAYAVLLAANGPLLISPAGRLAAQSSPAPAHSESSFDLVLKAPYSLVAPLFGAEGERAWGGADWDPHFLYPAPPKDVSGAVFTVEQGGHRALWMTPLYDLPGRHIQHIVIIPDAMVIKLDITFPESESGVTKVHVSHARTSLNPALNEHIANLAAHDPDMAHDWQRAIEAYLASVPKR